MKKLISLCLALTVFLTLSCGITVFASSPAKDTIVLQIGNQYMYVGGQQVELDAAPIIHKDRTMLPIRAVVEALGGTVGWNAENQQITMDIDGTQILMWLGKTTVMVDGDRLTMDVAPFVMNGRTLVPVRFVSDNIPGCETNWDGNTQSVYIVASSTEFTPPTPETPPTPPAPPVEVKTGYWQLTGVIENPAYKKEYKNENSGSTEIIVKDLEDTDPSLDSYIWTFNYAGWCSECGHDCGANGEHVAIGLTHSIPKDSYNGGEIAHLNLNAFIASRTSHSCLRIGTEIVAGLSSVNDDNIYYKSVTMEDSHGSGYTSAKITNGGYNDIHTGESYGESRTVGAKMPENCQVGDKVYIVVTMAPTSGARVELAYEYVWTLK